MKVLYSQVAKAHISEQGTIMPSKIYLTRKKRFPLTKKASIYIFTPLLSVVPAVKRKRSHVWRMFSRRPRCIHFPLTYIVIRSMNIDGPKWSGTINVSST